MRFCPDFHQIKTCAVVPPAPPLFPDQTIFDFPTSIFNHFHNKIVSAQRNIRYTAYKFYALYPEKGDFLEGNFCLCTENVMRVLDPFFLHIKSWCRKTLHT